MGCKHKIEVKDKQGKVIACRCKVTQCECQFIKGDFDLKCSILKAYPNLPYTPTSN